MTIDDAIINIQAIPDKIWNQLCDEERASMQMAFDALKQQKPAKWTVNAEGLDICSNCGEAALHDEWMQFGTDYCPHCGAKMFD